MARKLSQSEFYYELAKRSETDPDKIQFIWENLCEMLGDELLTYGSIFLPLLGEMKLQTRGGRKSFVPMNPYSGQSGEVKEIYIPPYQKIQFLPSEFFKNIINNDEDPKALIKRQREVYRKLKKEAEQREKQAIYMERAENACAEMRAKKKAKKEKYEQRKKTEAEKKAHDKEIKKLRKQLDVANRDKDYW